LNTLAFLSFQISQMVMAAMELSLGRAEGPTVVRNPVNQCSVYTVSPVFRHERISSNLITNLFPDLSCHRALTEQMLCRLQVSQTQQAEVFIRPASDHQPSCSPYPVLEH
jgi:hypothetical protein